MQQSPPSQRSGELRERWWIKGSSSSFYNQESCRNQEIMLLRTSIVLYQSSFNFLVTGGGGGYSTFSCTRNAERSTTACSVDPSSIHVIQSWLLQLPHGIRRVCQCNGPCNIRREGSWAEMSSPGRVFTMQQIYRD